MLFCPVPWFTSPIEDEYSASKKNRKDAPKTPLVEKVQESTLTPATEASTPGENSSMTPTGETSSLASNDDSLSTGIDNDVEKTSPIKPQALVFEESPKETIEEEKPVVEEEKMKEETEKPVVKEETIKEELKKPEIQKEKTPSFSFLKFIFMVAIYLFLSQSEFISPKATQPASRVVESATVEATIEATIEETIEAETPVEVEEPAVDIDVNVEDETDVIE